MTKITSQCHPLELQILHLLLVDHQVRDRRLIVVLRNMNQTIPRDDPPSDHDDDSGDNSSRDRRNRISMKTEVIEELMILLGEMRIAVPVAEVMTHLLIQMIVVAIPKSHLVVGSTRKLFVDLVLLV